MAATQPSTVSVVSLRDVGKAYRLFASRYDNFVDALGLARIMPWHRDRHQDFWALRGINLELGKGQRIGIVGRNGAGKTTLLKLIAGNLRPTTGSIRINGKIQALIDAGTGFHPDFTGRENVRASLTYQGFGPREVAEATRDIADFTELEEFMDRRFRTYSSGMMARLIFATATAIKPEILIIDEILGAGDAYFIGKSSERMKKLVETGASILLVSHSMEQITLLCDQAIWLDRGRIVKAGPSLDVVTAYGQFVHQLEDRRQRARNQKVTAGRRLAREVMDSYADSIVVRFVVPQPASLKTWDVRLFRGDELESECRVGDAQDSDTSQSSFVDLSTGDWSAPRDDNGEFFRTIQGRPEGDGAGSVAFNLYALYPGVRYSLEVAYRAEGPPTSLQLWRGGTLRHTFELPVHLETARFDLVNIQSNPRPTELAAPQRGIDEVGESESNEESPRAAESNGESALDQSAELRSGQTRWPGEGSLLIKSVQLVGGDGLEHALYRAGDSLRLKLAVQCMRDGSYPVQPAAVLYRIDGVKVFSHIGSVFDADLRAGEKFCLELDLGKLNLGDGHYAFAIAIYKSLQPVGESVWYDLIDRDYRFEVTGSRPFAGLYEHPGDWKRSDA